MTSYLPKTLAVAFFMSVSMGQASFAQSADMTNFSNRLDRIENELLTLNREVYRGGAASGTAGSSSASVPANYAASFEMRLGQVEDQIRSLTGSVEENQRALFDLKQMMTRMQSDTEYRFSQLEKNSGAGMASSSGTVVPVVTSTSAAPTPTTVSRGAQTVTRSGGSISSETLSAPAVTSPTPSTASSVSAPRKLFSSNGAADTSGAPKVLGVVRETAGTAAGTSSTNQTDAGAGLGPDAQYNFAYGELRKGNYTEAQTAFLEFKAKYPDHRLMPNVQYWLAETYYATGNYAKAALLFSEGYQDYPSSGKAADSLLKFSMALSAMGRSEDACVALSSLYGQFPAMAPQTRRIADREKEKMGCQ